ncbi:MAG TPA: FmdB family zinc ribbon protein [Bryobacteraceae bacterium]|nr:FmdB family zinc ribbon protein [Bryobacteraceae bacterium]
MPLYEYRCATCGSQFELLQKFSDAPLTVHEGCGGAVERLLSAPGLQFKGSGWYITDYKNSSPKGGSNGEGKSEGKTEGKSDAKDSKPAEETKTESKPAAAAKSSE